MGRELAIKFAALGAKPVLVDINEQGNKDTARQIAQLTGKKVHSYRYDKLEEKRQNHENRCSILL